MLSRAEKAWLVAILVLRHVMPLQIHTIVVHILSSFLVTTYMPPHTSPSRKQPCNYHQPKVYQNLIVEARVGGEPNTREALAAHSGEIDLGWTGNFNLSDDALYPSAPPNTQTCKYTNTGHCMPTVLRLTSDEQETSTSRRMLSIPLLLQIHKHASIQIQVTAWPLCWD